MNSQLKYGVAVEFTTYEAAMKERAHDIIYVIRHISQFFASRRVTGVTN